ncbi:DUF1963 domain-containing protein [Rhizobium terrae]|uniref:DUF1963 domain-containing protein n=1 Tax=Rhizobium terrae TaxID=2171756 RepID=UPI000E3E8C80|nr:DUF1963 domain-containing protein [Rhizobium terrae]
MFDTPVEARQVIEERFDASQVDMLLGQLRPALAFLPRDTDTKGGTRIGGVPDLPAGIVWPRRPVPENADEISKRSGEPYDKELRDHLAVGMSYAFFAQVDLGQAAGLGPAGAALPKEGRLLFFYDMIGGPFDTGTQSARVIWDRSPSADLSASPVPKDLAEAASAYRRMIDETNKRYGLEPEARKDGAPEPGTPYGGPLRPMALKAGLQLMPFLSLESQATGELQAIYSAGRSDGEPAADFTEAYDELSNSYYPPNQMLGLPVPVQDDPRFEAVAVKEFGKQFLSSEEWQANRAAIFEKARDWTLLLQIDVADWMQQSAEGTVYFLIQKNDLEKRDFDRVVAVYQQT